MATQSTNRSALVFAIAASALLLSGRAEAACDCSILPSLASALDYPAMSLFEDVAIAGAVWNENGNIGLGNEKGNNGEVLVIGTAARMDGIYHDFGTTVDASAITYDVVFQQDMSGVVADLRAAHAAFKAMTATQTFGTIDRNTTITGNGCINVIEVEAIDLLANDTLTLKGVYDDYFIFNLAQGFSIGGTAEVVLEGVEPNHVLYNLIGSSGDVDLQGDAAVYGTYINPDRIIEVSGNAENKGAYYSGEQLRLYGDATWYGKPFQCTKAASLCPDPRGEGVNIQTPATPPGRSNGNTSFFYSWYDPTTFEGHMESYKVKPDGKLEDESSANPIDPVTDLFKSSRDPWWDAGIRLRSNTSRKIYTSKGTPLARVPFDTNIDANDLGIGTGDVKSYPNNPASTITNLAKLEDAIVAYVHGKDAFDTKDGDGNRTEMRDTVLGDIFHSNILFVGTPNTILLHEEGYDGFYSSYKTRDRVAYAGANDAMLHGFDAGAYWDQTNPTSWNDGSGDELFGYVPGLLLPMAALTPKTIDINGDRLIPGFVDGNVTAADAWIGADSGNKLASEWATVIVSAYKEGGEGYLALDVTRPGATSGDHSPYPKFLWEFSHADLGESWSRPVITRVKVASGSTDDCGPDDGDGGCQEQWVAIFGGGMMATGDPNEDDYYGNYLSPAWDDKSKAIFIVSLDDGSLLSMVKFDSTGVNGHPEMKFSIPSAPAVLDLNHDGFADVIYIGDLGGQMWKWDVSAVGTDSADTDTLIDNWNSGRIFATPRTSLGASQYHYRQFYHPASAAYVNGVLHLAFGSGEEKDILYQGDASRDDENRFYVIQDLNPTGASAFSTLITEAANLTDVTSTASYADPGNLGYYFKGAESEKFITDTIIFAGHVLTASYIPTAVPACGPGTARFYAFELGNAEGFFDANNVAETTDRYMDIGTGVPSNPRVSVASDPQHDVVFVTTSEGELIEIEPPLRDPPESSFLYWRRRY
jgi:Tfp pilus tip-associated adhesin PilY1